MRFQVVVALALLSAGIARAQEESDQALFDKAWALQDGKKDWAAAEEIYGKLVERRAAGRELAVRTLYERGVCLAKLEKTEDAHFAFYLVCDEFPSESGWCAKASAASAGLRPASTDEATLKKLKSSHVSATFRECKFLEAVAFMEEVSDLGIRIEESVWLLFSTARVSFRVEDLPMIDAIDLMARQAGLGWTIEDGRIVFGIPIEQKDRVRPAPSDTPESTKALLERLYAAKVTLNARDEKPLALVEYLRIATRLPIVPGRELLSNSGLNFRVVDGVILLDP
ncbi:MAG: hypothetical protein K8T20_15880 [Planctomycetes bacterium]|nr:hypothetical protein [Planctomycetota bacterium]